jgi:protease I
MGRVAIVLNDEFVEAEVETALQRVADAGHEPVVVGCERSAMLTGAGGSASHVVEATPEQVVVNDLDALMVPGGAPVDDLAADDRIVSLCKHMALAGKPVGLTGHGGALLAGTSVLEGRSLTSLPEDRPALEGAGATWVDAPLVEDGNLLSARDPADVAPLCDALLTRLE